VNSKLACGLGLLALLCSVAALSGLLAPHEVGYSKSISTEMVGGKEVLVVAPEPPGRHFLFGSDPWGHDIFSDMVHGLPWTLGIVFLTAAVRCLIGLVGGLYLGSSGRAKPLRRGFSPLSALPGFIIAAFVLYPVTINPTVPSLGLFLVQAAVLVLVEIAPITAFFKARTASISAMPFVEAARVGGADRAWVVRHHILPHIAVDFVEALPLQALSVAAMIGKLGIAKLFIGGTFRRVDPEILLPAKSEWLGLLGCYYDRMLSQPWLFLAPFGGWLIILASAWLLATGLRDGLERTRRMT
jgi:peptide/nickel transport system permease protein